MLLWTSCDWRVYEYASPGVCPFQPDKHYKDHKKYLTALADAMKSEYEAIVAAGFVLQLDSPDLELEGI